MLKFAILGIAAVAIALAVAVYVADPKPIPPSRTWPKPNVPNRVTYFR